MSTMLNVTHTRPDRRRQPAEDQDTRGILLRQRDALMDFVTVELSTEDETTALRRLTETAAKTLQVARVSVWRYNPERTAIQCADLYERLPIATAREWSCGPPTTLRISRRSASST